MQTVATAVALCGALTFAVFPDTDLTSGRAPGGKTLEIVPAESGDPAEGIYSFWGLDSKDAYRGSLHVVRVGDAYLVRWDFSVYTLTGVGLRTGDLLVVGWQLEGNKVNTTGVHKMKKTADGWEGTWTGLPGGRRRPETWKYLGKLPRIEKGEQ